MFKIQDYTWANQTLQTYGRAIRISKARIMVIIALFCLITPCTNWIIPLLPKIIKRSKTIRY